jgi:hypothetical protein
MSEYQCYEWMTIDRPLTAKELDEVDDLSSHIEATPTHALIEYHWGDFKHDPIDVLYRYFDGFLYWANWGSPQLAFRFPHGVLPADLLDGYDLEDFATFTLHSDYDILNIEFGEMEAPDEWVDYELGSLIPIRDELMEGDLRSLYIVWLAAQGMMGDYDEDYDDEEEDEDYEEEESEEEEYEIDIPPVPAGFGELTAAQYSLAELFRVPQELLDAAARHSQKARSTREDDFAAWVRLLPPDRQQDYLVRLARNEPGLSRQLVRELRELGQDKSGAAPPEGERVPYATLLAESKGIRARLEDERREQERAARLRHLQEVHDQQDTYWRQIEQATARPAGARYDEALRLLVDLRDAAEQFGETRQFQERFRTWVRPLLRRPALVERLRAKGFVLPEA